MHNRSERRLFGVRTSKHEALIPNHALSSPLRLPHDSFISSVSKVGPFHGSQRLQCEDGFNVICPR